jgi:hypothetical protein
MPEMKPGTRLRSTVCTTEVMVVAAQKDAAIELCCGGRPMRDMEAPPTAVDTPAPAFASGTQIGKRYVSEAGTLEVLCTKPGQGSLSVEGVALKVKGAKPLPSSD